MRNDLGLTAGDHRPWAHHRRQFADLSRDASVLSAAQFRKLEHRCCCAASGAASENVWRVRANSGGTANVAEAATHACGRRWKLLIRFGAMLMGECYG